ncbi:MAG TPA: hypothetical protein PKM72_15380 [Nitrospirales bacterium]|nr:hypothetical protein [Nitrospirales bacterium]
MMATPSKFSDSFLPSGTSTCFRILSVFSRYGLITNTGLRVAIR